MRKGQTNEYLRAEAENGEFFEIDEIGLRNRELITKALERIQKADIIKENKDILIEYANEYISNGKVKATSISSIVMAVVELAKSLNKPFLDIIKPDISKHLMELRAKIFHNKQLAEASLICKNVYIKHFFKWLYDNKSIEYKRDYPDVVDHLNTIRPRKILQPNALLTPLEIRAMVESCYKKRDKAVLMMLYESGCRASELTNLKIGDIKIETHSIDMTIRVSKTIPRTNTLIDSYVYVLDYLNEHPYKTNPKAPLFLNLSNGQYSRSLLYQGLSSIVNTAKKRARIHKRITPHLFRHSRATHLASQGWTEAQLRQWFGWSSISSTPTIYVHIGQADIKKKILRDSGVLSDEETLEEAKEKIALKSKKCVRCGKLNPADALACNCGMALSLASVEQIKQLKEKSDGFMEKLNQLPIRPNLIREGMTQLDYKKFLIKSDPFLKEEFQKVADEIIQKMLLKKKFDSPQDPTEVITNKETTRKNTDRVLEFRNKGWTMEEIAEHLGIGYGTVNKICKENGLSNIYCEEAK